VSFSYRAPSTYTHTAVPEDESSGIGESTLTLQDGVGVVALKTRDGQTSKQSLTADEAAVALAVFDFFSPQALLRRAAAEERTAVDEDEGSENGHAVKVLTVRRGHDRWVLTVDGESHLVIRATYSGLGDGGGRTTATLTRFEYPGGSAFTPVRPPL
jgi:hypothetical protein